ncbi:MAG: YcxB family protein [Oscillospiraceae bacterium]|nr:YcxB family protein [Oscillospiraceae bacterium]
MNFSFVTQYNREAVATMAKALRKTVRRKKSRRSHIIGVAVILLALLLALPFGNENNPFEFKDAITLAVAAILGLTLIFEDRINGDIAMKRMLPGLKSSKAVFGEDSYTSETEVGTSEFRYDNIVMLAENSDYFVFIFSANHAQVYDKNSLSGGTARQFREFITKKTGREILQF